MSLMAKRDYIGITFMATLRYTLFTLTQAHPVFYYFQVNDITVKCVRSVIDYTLSVSYTHLDVYKRQIVEVSMTFDFGEDQLRERDSLPATFVLTRVIVSMTNDNCRPFKQNQIMFCIQP